MPLEDLAIAVTSFDSHRTIEQLLRSVDGLAARTVVVDSGSTDGTTDICRAAGAEVVHHPWEGYVEQKRFAIEQCRAAPWVLLLDSDESLEPDLRRAVERAVRTDDAGIAGWWVNRRIWFLGGWLRHCYQPEWRLRLVRPERTRVVGHGAHDRLEVEGRTARLAGILRHESWADLSDLARRQLRYAQSAADERRGGGSAWNLLVNPPAAMFKQLVLKGGYRDGIRGLIVAGMTFNFTMLKHATIAARLLAERTGRGRTKGPGGGST
jgi:glycosyltransferase involved in cell wall biosynthesis